MFERRFASGDKELRMGFFIQKKHRPGSQSFGHHKVLVVFGRCHGGDGSLDFGHFGLGVQGAKKGLFPVSVGLQLVLYRLLMKIEVLGHLQEQTVL